MGPALAIVSVFGCSADGPRCDGATACRSEAQASLRADPADLARAAAAFDRACGAGDLQSCTDLGLLVQDGRGAERDPDRAVALYRKACDGGLGVGCSNLGMLYESGTGGVRIDREKANAAYKAALVAYRASCSGSTPTGCANLGWMLEAGRGGPPHPDEAAQAWRRGCDGGEVDACVNALVHRLDVGADVPGAIAELRTLCSEDAPSACGPLARAIGPTEPESATLFAARGCELGDADACGVLGVLLGAAGVDAASPASGLRSSGAAWERACRLGRSEGCVRISEEIVGGGGLATPAGRAAAIEHLELACHIGDPRACMRLAAGWEGEDLGATDLERAFAARDEACRLGWPEACVALLTASRELPLDGAVRARFVADACERGVNEACALR